MPLEDCHCVPDPTLTTNSTDTQEHRRLSCKSSMVASQDCQQSQSHAGASQAPAGPRQHAGCATSERLTLWRDAGAAQGPRAHNGALALTVMVYQEGWQVLVRVIRYALCRQYFQELHILVLGCKFLQAGPHNLAAQHPAHMYICSEISLM